MYIDTFGTGSFIIIFVMAIVTLATRWGGIFAMSFIPMNDKVVRFISAMSGSVLVALLAPIALTGDDAARLALLASAITMLLFKKPLLAISAGIIVAALYRQLASNGM